MLTVSSRLSPVKPGAMTAMRTRRRHHAERDQHRDHQREQRADGARDAVGFLAIAVRQQSGVDRDERAGERAFAEEILKNVGNAKGGVERVGRVGL